MDMRTYINQFYIFLNKLSPERFDMCWEERIPLLGEDTNSMGFNVDYVYHLGWAARIIAKNKPEVHYDLSSSIWLNSVLSAFIPVKAYEFRKLNVNLEGLECGDADILKLPFESNSITSLSCLSVLEHIGLGKYGDEIDPDGDLKELNEHLAGLLHCEVDQVYVEIEKLLDKIIARKKLHEYGMTEDQIQSFAEGVEQNQQRLLNQSYVKFNVEQMVKIYRQLF